MSKIIVGTCSTHPPLFLVVTNVFGGLNEIFFSNFALRPIFSAWLQNDSSDFMQIMFEHLCYSCAKFLFVSAYFFSVEVIRRKLRCLRAIRGRQISTVANKLDKQRENFAARDTHSDSSMSSNIAFPVGKTIHTYAHLV